MFGFIVEFFAKYREALWPQPFEVRQILYRRCDFTDKLIKYENEKTI